MALDVHLVREVNERWGFALVGGADDEMPITIEKLQPSSPADRAGLQNGDTVLTINGEEAIDFTYEEACRRVAECGDSLTFGVMRGLYDPVLDDQDPICYEPGDLDPSSQPTEVPFEVQKFLEPADLGSNLIDINDTIDPLGTPFDPSVLLNDPRSLTASPFLIPTKPYRPFSTEPVVEVPALEEPIILNPDYKDQFGEEAKDVNPEYLLNAHCNGEVKNKFKLPISAQYDPDGTKLVKNVEIDSVLSKYVNMEMMSKKSVVTVEQNVKTSVKDVKVTDKVCVDVKTATNVSKESKSSVKIDESLTNYATTEECSTIKTEEVSIKKDNLKKDVKVSEKTETCIESRDEVTKEELKYIEKMRQEIDIAQIEETAISVVEDSIERAVSVAEEIKKEMEEETTSVTELETETVIAEAEKIVSSIKSEKKMKDSGEIGESEFKTEAHETDFEAIDKIASNKEHLQISKTNENFKEIPEIHKDTKTDIESKSITSEEVYSSTKKETPKQKESVSQESKHAELRSENKGEFKTVTKTMTTGTKSDKSEAQQRTYAIGLQTIPNIRGVVHSSYHYDLLLRTFFLHLTDVMVALSRFVLTQPIFNTQSLETRETVSETQMSQSETRDIKKRQQEVVETVKKVENQKAEESKMGAELKQETRVEVRKEVIKPVILQEKKQEVKAVSQKIEKKVEEKKVEKRELVTPVHMSETKIEAHECVKKEKIEQSMKVDSKDTKEVAKLEEKKIISGAEMAQRTEKKVTKDVTQKMDAVITEFHTIAVEEDKKEMLQRSRRSRSRSQIEEEVAKESDPLEWLHKVDSRRASQEISEERLSKKEYAASATFEKKSFEKLEKQEIKHKKVKTPKQMYIAVVEAHVYTNKDVIFEDAAEFSETSSVQSADETNTAFEAIELMSTENVALENAVQQIEQAKIVEETRELSSVTAKSAATVHKIEETVHETENIIEEKYTNETAVQSTGIQEVIIQETKEVIEPVLEFKETIKKESVSVDINESLSVAESKEINIHESKSEFASVRSKEETVAIVAEDYLESAVVEASTEIVESKQKVEIEVAKTEIKAEPQVQIEDITDKVVLKSEKVDIKNEDESASLKIIKEVEKEIEPGNDIVEIEEVEVKKIEISKELSLDQSTLVAVSSTVDVSLESESKKSEIDITKSNHTSVSVENYSSSFKSEDVIQEASFTARSVDNLSVDVSLESESKKSEIDITSESNHTSVSVENYSSSLTSEDVIQEASFTARSVNNLSVNVSLESESKKSVSNHTSTSIEDVIQEASFTARSTDKKLTLRTDLDSQASIQSPPSTIDTPTPSTVPPTPLTDEYVFKLSLPLPKNCGTTPVPRDCTLSPEDEDPHIVKKKLIPHIETTIEKIVYDPPLPTPPGDKVQSPIFKMPGLFGGANKPIYKIRFPPNYIYRKPGLFGGSDDLDYSKEEIREIERKSSLLASAIDETIKSIEEYKEEVGIEKKKEVHFAEFKEERISKSCKESYSETTVVESIQNGIEESNTTIEEVIENNDVTTNNNNTEEITVEKVTQNEEMEIPKESSDTDLVKEIYIKNNNVTIDVMKPTVIEEIEQDTKIETTVETNDVSLTNENQIEEQTEKKDPMLGFRSVVFDPESIQKRNQYIAIEEPTNQEPRGSPYLTESGEVIGTVQGIVDGLEEPVMDPELAKELGKPGISEEKIAEMMSGEAEMLREAHVMGLARVLTSHMARLDDSSVDFQKIKPMIDSLKDSEVLKALNEDLARQREEQKKKEEKRWTTFLQKPKRSAPKPKFGYHGWTEAEQALVAEPYKVKIVKQAKPKVAPDYKPEDFETGPLPWEERAGLEDSLPPVEPEEPILIPELPEYLEAVDPLKESEVPDLEDTGIPLPPPREPTPPPEPYPEEEEPLIEEEPEEPEEPVTKIVEEKQETREDMENRLAEQLVRSVQGMVDPNASVDQQLSQMRAQLAALAQLPEVIQQTLSLVSQQLNKMTQQEAHMEMKASHTESQSCEEIEVTENHVTESQEVQSSVNTAENTEVTNQVTTYENGTDTIIEELEENKTLDQEKNLEDLMRVQTSQMIEEDMKNEKMQKGQQYQARLDFEARQIKQRPTPRAGKPKSVFGPLDPDSRPVVLPGGRRWRNTTDVYNEQLFAETVQAQSELIQGKAMGFESDLLPYDSRINFMKYEKPPVSLDHLQNSETYKLVHDMDQPPLKRVEMRTPVIAEADYRERCRSTTPSCGDKKFIQIPLQFHP